MPGPVRKPRNGGLDRAKDFKGSMLKLIKNYLVNYKWQLYLI